MASIIGPLLSISASGRFGNIEFRALGSGKHQAMPLRKKPKTRNATQINQASRFKTASTAWNALTQLQKNAWNAGAKDTGTIGYRFYLSEYLNQGIQPPDQPTMP